MSTTHVPIGGAVEPWPASREVIVGENHLVVDVERSSTSNPFRVWEGAGRLHLIWPSGRHTWRIPCYLPAGCGKKPTAGGGEAFLSDLCGKCRNCALLKSEAILIFCAGSRSNFVS